MLNIKLLHLVDEFLDTAFFDDVSYNGLQVEGKKEVTFVATAATASLDAVNAAVSIGADALLVHHGLFWKGADSRTIGSMKKRLKALMDADINLYAWHLPLDANDKIGNNRYLIDLLNPEKFDYVRPGDKSSIAMRALLKEPVAVKDAGQLLSLKLDTEVAVIGNADPDFLISNIAVCSGSGSFILEKGCFEKYDALITGDVSEQTYHLAKETETLVFAVGHYASEQDGIRLLGEYLGQQCGLKHQHLHFAPEKSVLWYPKSRSF